MAICHILRQVISCQGACNHFLPAATYYTPAPATQQGPLSCSHVRNAKKCKISYQFSELFGRAWMQGMTITNILGTFCTTDVYRSGPLEPVGSVGPWPNQKFGQAYFLRRILSLFWCSIRLGTRSLSGFLSGSSSSSSYRL